MRIDHYLEHTAARMPDKTALICGDRHWSYATLEQTARRVAAAFGECGLRPGDRVALFLDNSFEAVASLYGASLAGAVFLVLNPTMRAGKLARILRDSGASLLVSQTSRLPVLEEGLRELPGVRHLLLCGTGGDAGADGPLPAIRGGIAVTPWEVSLDAGGVSDPPRSGDDTALAALIYTSGSTGEPKGVMSTHANMAAAIGSITTYLENDERDIVLNVLPLSFDYGLYQVLMTVAFGGTLVLEKSFAYPFRIVERLIAERVTGFPIVPTMAAILLRMKGLREYHFDSLRYVTNTAAALQPEQISGLRELFPSARIYSMYGLTECKRVSYLPPDRLHEKPASVGIPMPGTSVSVVDESGREVGPGETGELVVRGPNVMQGYWNAPEESARVFRPDGEDGGRALYSGDLFRRDEEGFLYFVGRKDDQIKSMGERVSPREIETVLCALPSVSEAAVIGVPDTIAGRAIKAVIVAAPGADPTAAAIIRHCRKHLEPFMIPTYVEFVASLPLTPHGKIDKQALERMHQERSTDGQEEC